MDKEGSADMKKSDRGASARSAVRRGDLSEQSPVSAGGIVPSRRPPRGRRSDKGFTLIELMVVVAIIGILVSMAVPTYRGIVLRARETVLKQNLYVLRDCIDQYYEDKGKFPGTLDQLVSGGYLRTLPVDPMTGKADWVTVPYSGSGEGQLEPTEGEEAAGIWDVHSADPKYEKW